MSYIPNKFPEIIYRDENRVFLHSTNSIAFGMPVGSTVSLPVKDFSKVKSAKDVKKEYCKKNNIEENKMSFKDKCLYWVESLVASQPSTTTLYEIVDLQQKTNGNIDVTVKKKI